MRIQRSATCVSACSPVLQPLRSPVLADDGSYAALLGGERASSNWTTSNGASSLNGGSRASKPFGSSEDDETSLEDRKLRAYVEKEVVAGPGMDEALRISEQSVYRSCTNGDAALSKAALSRLARYPSELLSRYKADPARYYRKFAGISDYFELNARDDRAYNILPDFERARKFVDGLLNKTSDPSTSSRPPTGAPHYEGPGTGIRQIKSQNTTSTARSSSLVERSTSSLVEDNDAINARTTTPLAKQMQRRVMIHCVKGVNRSSAVLTAFLMSYRRWTVKQAVEHVSERRLSVLTNENFLQQLVKHEKMLFLNYEVDDQNHSYSTLSLPQE
ncbi:unnamed protein product, partial [Amoebophrya sp. A25]|eukprot:GSA25T00010811001.1